MNVFWTLVFPCVKFSSYDDGECIILRHSPYIQITPLRAIMFQLVKIKSGISANDYTSVCLVEENERTTHLKV